MSADEDTELRDLVAQTLETNGTLGKLRAQLRASVFLALEDQENGQNKAPFLNKELRSFLSTRDGKLAASLVKEFLEFFNLEFTLAVFNPETGLSDPETRSDLLKELNIKSQNGRGTSPLLVSLLQNNGADVAKNIVKGNDEPGAMKTQIASELTEKQIQDAREKFHFYDKDNSGAIEKDELRELFMDMFPNFHRNMLDRYVNDEFRAVDKDFSSSIDFEEFLGMYKRLFLFCRTVVTGDSVDEVPTSEKPTNKRNTFGKSSSPPPLPTSAPPPLDSRNGFAKQKDDGADHLGSDTEEDPFFDDVPASAVSFNTLSSELGKNKEIKAGTQKNSTDSKPTEKPSNSMASLDGLPSLGGGGAGGMGSLAGAPALGRPKSPLNDTNYELDQNLRAIDKRMEDLGLDGHNDDFEYEDDFSPEPSVSQKAFKTESKVETAENGSIAEEIDDEEIDDISIEADDLLRSDKSGFDDLTTDHSISQADGGFDYMEDPVSP